MKAVADDASKVGKGINASGQLVGYSTTTGDVSDDAFVYDAVHGMVDLNSLIDPLSGWDLLYAFAINDNGQITGQGIIDGDRHAFLLTPVPEPSTLVLGCAGLVGLTLLACRRMRRVSAR